MKRTLRFGLLAVLRLGISVIGGRPIDDHKEHDQHEAGRYTAH